MITTTTELFFRDTRYIASTRTAVFFTLFREVTIRDEAIKLIGYNKLIRIYDIFKDIPSATLISPELVFGSSIISRVYMLNFFRGLLTSMPERAVNRIICHFFGLKEVILNILLENFPPIIYSVLDQYTYRDFEILERPRLELLTMSYHAMNSSEGVDKSIVYQIGRSNILICGEEIRKSVEIGERTVSDMSSEFICDDLYRTLSEIIIKPVLVTHYVRKGIHNLGYGYYNEAYILFKQYLNRFNFFKVREYDSEYHEEGYITVGRSSVLSALGMYGKYVDGTTWVKSLKVYEQVRFVAFDNQDRCLMIILGVDSIYLHHMINIMRLTKEVKLIVGNNDEDYSEEMEDAVLKLMLSDVFTSEKVSCAPYLDIHNNLPTVLNELISSYL